jgi:hypothetical protein
VLCSLTTDRAVADLPLNLFLGGVFSGFWGVLAFFSAEQWESETEEIFSGARERFSSVKRQEDEQYSALRKDLDGHFNGELSRESNRRRQILNRLAHLGLEDGERSICFLLLARAFEADTLAWNILRFISTWEDPRLDSKYWTSSFVYHDLRVMTRFGVIRKSGDIVTTVEQIEVQVREEERTATTSKTELKTSIMRKLEPRGTPSESGHTEESEEEEEEGTWDEDIDGPFCQASVFLKQFRERQKTVGASHRPDAKLDSADHMYACHSMHLSFAHSTDVVLNDMYLWFNHRCRRHVQNKQCFLSVKAASAISSAGTGWRCIHSAASEEGNSFQGMQPRCCPHVLVTTLITFFMFIINGLSLESSRCSIGRSVSKAVYAK